MCIPDPMDNNLDKSTVPFTIIKIYICSKLTMELFLFFGMVPMYIPDHCRQSVFGTLLPAIKDDI